MGQDLVLGLSWCHPPLIWISRHRVGRARDLGVMGGDDLGLRSVAHCSQPGSGGFGGSAWECPPHPVFSRCLWAAWGSLLYLGSGVSFLWHSCLRPQTRFLGRARSPYQTLLSSIWPDSSDATVLLPLTDLKVPLLGSLQVASELPPFPVDRTVGWPCLVCPRAGVVGLVQVEGAYMA